MFRDNLKTGLLDLDLQGSSSELLKEEGIEILNPHTPTGELPHLPHDILFIDTPPYLSSRLLDILQVADVVLIPTRSGAFDAMALTDTVNLVEKAKEKNPQLKAAIVFTMVKPGSTITEEIRPVINTGSIPVLDQVITERVCYTRSLLTGGVLKSKDNKAKLEMMEMTEAVVKLLGL